MPFEVEGLGKPIKVEGLGITSSANEKHEHIVMKELDFMSDVFAS